MKNSWTVLFVLALLAPVAASAAPAASAPSLIITDKAAVQTWQHSTYGQQQGTPDDVTGDTQLLLSLNPSELEGARLFRQHCDACHGPDAVGAKSYGPRLSKQTMNGDASAVQTQISLGSANMPAFRYALQPEQIAEIISYLKKIDGYCTDCRPGDVRRASAVMK